MRSPNSRHAVGDATTPSAARGGDVGGKSVQRAGIVPTLPSTNRQRNIVSPSSVRQPSTSSSTSHSAAGAAISRTRSGNGLTT
jgi:hypothetical protein